MNNQISPPVDGVEQRLDEIISLLRDMQQKLNPSHLPNNGEIHLREPVSDDGRVAPISPAPAYAKPKGKSK